MSECGLSRVSGALFQVGGGVWDYYFGWVGVSGGEWLIILGEWGWMGHFFGWVRMSGSGWG